MRMRKFLRLQLQNEDLIIEFLAILALFMEKNPSAFAFDLIEFDEGLIIEVLSGIARFLWHKVLNFT